MEESSKVKTVGKIIKIIFTVMLFVFIGALIFRMCQASYKGLEETNISPAFKEAYKQSTDVRTHAVNAEFSENGAVYAYSLVYIEKAGYLQFTVRYNIRHIEGVQETYKEFKEDDIVYRLIGSKKGSTEKVEYIPTVLDHAQEYNYHYFKLEFTNVDFSADTLSIKMILEGIEIKIGEKSTLAIHKKDDTYIPYYFEDEEKELLK